MMKLAFYKTNELNELLNKVMNTENEDKSNCEIQFSEELDTEVVKVLEAGVEKEEVELWDLLKDMSRHMGIKITNYDVIEVGDRGEGFAFFY